MAALGVDEVVPIIDLDEVPHTVDLLVVGSGPIGSTFARTVRTMLPEARILMVDAGPVLTSPPGEHHDNLKAPAAFGRPVFNAGQHAARDDGEFHLVAPRPGTQLVFGPNSDLPAYAQATNVGGMGVFWTCATPQPDPVECEPAIPTAEWHQALRVAERLLHVRTDCWPINDTIQALLHELRAGYPELPPDRGVGVMPTAMTRNGGRPRWTGPAHILADLMSERTATFAILPRTLCANLAVHASRVTSARLRAATGGPEVTVTAAVVAVAADSIRTPQLLWASGVRPSALGRYIGEHFQLLAAVVWPGRVPAIWGDDRVGAMLWLPFSESHPYHGQIMLFDQEPGDAGASASGEASVVGLGWLVPPTIDCNNRVDFSQAATDPAGMPRPLISYPLCDEDRRQIRAAADDQRRAMRVLGGHAVRGGEPRLLPRGSSLHLIGTVRMGSRADGTSVCDSEGRVWGIDNLFVAGNGVISASTACNPTLTSAALAVRAAASAARVIAGS